MEWTPLPTFPKSEDVKALPDAVVIRQDSSGRMVEMFGLPVVYRDVEPITAGDPAFGPLVDPRKKVL